MNSLLRSTFLFYFLSHIPITIIVDAQVVLGSVYPEPLQNLLNWYYTTFSDKLIETGPLWLQSFIWAELLFQLPFFFAASYALLYKKNWIRIPGIIYGAHVATTVWAILAETLWSEAIDQTQKLCLFGFYFPYFLIPVLFSTYLALNPSPFSKKKGNKNT